MTIRVNTVDSNAATPGDGLNIERLRIIVQDSHLNFLVGAGTPSSYFSRLGDIELALTEIADSSADASAQALARASVQGYFFENVLLPNLQLVKRDVVAQEVLTSYATFLRTLNRILLKRRSSLLGKQVNIFTTNVDMAFEVALEMMEIDVNDGFVGKIKPRLDLAEFNTLRFRQGVRYEYRSEIPMVNLFKIHGSAAWEQSDGDEIFFDHSLSQVEATKETFDHAKSELLSIDNPDAVDATALLAAAAGVAMSANALAFAESYEKLSIVNPEKTKFATAVLNQTYYELIRRFANELEKENSALFVHGFSFRDEHLRDLVLRAARTNPTLQVVVFCHSRKSRDELGALFPDTQVKNGNILLVAPAEPQEGESEQKLTLDIVERQYFAQVIADKIRTPDHVIELQLRDDTEASTDV